jgi:hypothetical protein
LKGLTNFSLICLDIELLHCLWNSFVTNLQIQFCVFFIAFFQRKITTSSSIKLRLLPVSSLHPKDLLPLKLSLSLAFQKPPPSQTVSLPCIPKTSSPLKLSLSLASQRPPTPQTPSLPRIPKTSYPSNSLSPFIQNTLSPLHSKDLLPPPQSLSLSPVVTAPARRCNEYYEPATSACRPIE